MQTRAAEFKAGLVVLAGVAVLLGFLYFAGGEIKPWGSYHYWDLRFIESSAAPRAGDAVEMNGVVIGSVESVAQAEEIRRDEQLTANDRLALGLAAGQPGVFRDIYVRARIRTDENLRLPSDTRAVISTNIAGVRSLALVPGHSTENRTPESTRERPIPAYQAPGLEAITTKLDTALVDIKAAASSIARLADRGDAVLLETLALVQDLRAKVEAVDTKGLNDEAKGVLTEIRTAVGGLGAKIETIATNLEAASANAVAMTSEGREAVAAARKDVQAFLGSARSAAERLDQILSDAAPRLDTFLASLERTGTNMETLSAELHGLGPQASQILAELGLDADELMGWLKDASHNIYDASEDIRAHPWKLMNEPEPGQIAFENLRGASQNYMRAMERLQAASTRLEQVLGRDDQASDTTQALLRKATEAFQVALERYEEDERQWATLFRRADNQLLRGGGR